MKETTRAVALLAALLAAATSPAPARAQDLRVIADTTPVTVGDRVTVEVRFEGALAPPVDSVPRFAGELPPGLRLLEADTLRVTSDGTLRARLVVAFFRPGSRTIPPVALAVGGAGAAPDTLRSEPIPITVSAVLPPGDQPLKDIKDLEPLPPESRLLLWLALAALALLIVVLLIVYRRRRRRADVAAPAPTAPPPDTRTAYEVAVERLDEIERARLPARGRVARHYELVADALRRYLEDGLGVPALELTTAELVWSLPPALAADGLRERCRDLFAEADLVKFARVRPTAEEAATLLASARALLDDWHEATAPASASAPELETAGLP